MLRAVELRKDCIRILDQTMLPKKVSFLKCRTVQELVEALRGMRVRGAPLIGMAGAMWLALAASKSRTKQREKLLEELNSAAELLREARPTGRDLHFYLDRMLRVARESSDVARALVREARKIEREMVEISKRLGEEGSKLISDGQTVLTHCNTGSLAMPGEGTALAAIKFAWRQGKRIKVLVTETRPLLQGARLTCWELEREGIPHRLIVDSAAGLCMQRGMVDLVMVGADRILANGDVINKVGTYPLAVLAKRHGIPFYVVAPSSTLDERVEVIIEERGREEVLETVGLGALKVEVYNPAFDLTPAELVTAVVTERGIWRAAKLARKS
ncbi:MAG: S-methyl-5-thioribose-1-phosphate isomerase [Candidatus Hadarchaeales archaeon]